MRTVRGFVVRLFLSAPFTPFPPASGKVRALGEASSVTYGSGYKLSMQNDSPTPTRPPYLLSGLSPEGYHTRVLVYLLCGSAVAINDTNTTVCVRAHGDRSPLVVVGSNILSYFFTLILIKNWYCTTWYYATVLLYCRSQPACWLCVYQYRFGFMPRAGVSTIWRCIGREEGRVVATVLLERCRRWYRGCEVPPEAGESSRRCCDAEVGASGCNVVWYSLLLVPRHLTPPSPFPYLVS